MLRKNIIQEMLCIARPECNYLLNLINSLNQNILDNKTISNHHRKLISIETQKLINLHERYNRELNNIETSLKETNCWSEINLLKLCMVLLRSQFKESQINFIYSLIQMNKSFNPSMEKLYYTIFPQLALDPFTEPASKEFINNFVKILDEYRENIISEIQCQFLLKDLKNANVEKLIASVTTHKNYYIERTGMKFMIVLTFLKMNCKFFCAAFQYADFDRWCEENPETGLAELSETLLNCFPSQDMLAEFGESLLEYDYSGNENRLLRYFSHPAHKYCESQDDNLILCLYDILMGGKLINIENIINTWRRSFKDPEIKNIQSVSQFVHSIWYRPKQEEIMTNNVSLSNSM